VFIAVFGGDFIECALRLGDALCAFIASFAVAGIEIIAIDATAAMRAVAGKESLSFTA
jgi:hypothetical protein